MSTLISEIRTAIDPLLDPTDLAGAVFYGVVIFSAGGLVSWVLGAFIHRWEKHFRHLFRGVDETVWRFTIHLKSLVVMGIALVVYATVIPGLRSILTTLAAGAGLTAVIIGFAAKSTLSNLIAGLALAIFRPIRIGDTVAIENEYGVIEDITIRHTVLLTWEHKRIVIPNEKLDKITVVNYSMTDPRMLLRLEFSVSYDTDIDLARRLILDEVMKCPHRLDSSHAFGNPTVRVVEHADFCIKLRAYLWTANIDESWYGRFWLLEHVKKRFDQEGVEIPFPYRTLVYKNDLPAARRENLQEIECTPQPEASHEEEPGAEAIEQCEPQQMGPKENKSGLKKLWGFLTRNQDKSNNPLPPASEQTLSQERKSG